MRSTDRASRNQKLPTIGALLAESAARYGDRPALIYRGRGLTVSYRGLLTQAERVANSLAALGIVPGEHVAVWAPNIPEWIVLQFGCALHGAVLVPVNTNYHVFELEHLLTQSDTVALFLVDGPRRGEYSAILRDLCPELEHAGGRDLHLSRLPCLRHVVRLDAEHAAGMLGWEEFLAAGGAAACSPGGRDATDIAMILYTSGTTGFPKGVMLSHANMIGNARSVGEAMRLTAEDRLCIPVPFFHCFGSVMGILLCAARGAAMVPLESFRPAEVLETVAACRCTALHGVPAMFIAEMEELRKGGYDTSSLRTGMMGGSPCPQEVMRAVTEQMGARELCIAYGLTETSPIITLTRPDAPLELRASTVGTPLPGVEVKIVHPRSGEPVPPAVQGELCCRGPNVMRGYYKLPEATAQTIDPEGWFHSGDLATQDEAGYVRITGRAKDMIIRGGENIYPREIEEFLFTHPAVKDAQVLGVPSSFDGEEVVAFVQVKADCAADGRQLRTFCAGRIARHKVPRRVFIVDHYPTTASGKVQKYRLRAHAITLLGLEAEAKSVVSRSQILSLEPGRDSSGRIFAFMDDQVAPWGIDTRVLFRAAAALNELVEAVHAAALCEEALEVRFTFDNFNLAADIRYRGRAPEFSRTRPSPESLACDPGAVTQMAGYLIHQYASHLTAECHDGVCALHFYFEP